MTQMRKILIVIITIIAIVIIGFNYFGPRVIIQIQSKLFALLRPIDKTVIPKPEDYNFDYERISIRTADNLMLKAYLIRTESTKQKGTIILTHGIRAYKEHFFPVCKMLSDSGYNSIAIDLRAHGESEGKYCTYGYLEHHDLSILIDSILQFENLSQNIGIWGQSMGGAVAILTLASDRRLKFGIIESTFSDFNTIVHDYIKHFIGFDIPFISNYLIFRAERIAHFDSELIVPSKSATMITQPVFMAHGKLDDRISYIYGQINFANLVSQNKQFLVLPNANHLNVWRVGGGEYFAKILRFIDDQCKN